MRPHLIESLVAVPLVPVAKEPVTEADKHRFLAVPRELVGG